MRCADAWEAWSSDGGSGLCAGSRFRGILGLDPLLGAVSDSGREVVVSSWVTLSERLSIVIWVVVVEAKRLAILPVAGGVADILAGSGTGVFVGVGVVRGVVVGWLVVAMVVGVSSCRRCRGWRGCGKSGCC